MCYNAAIMQKGSRDLPFDVRRDDGRSLTDQVADGLLEGIRAGRWRPGTPLPTRAALVAALGVSKNVVQRAIARLSAEGLVVPRGRLGCIVRRAGALKLGRRVLEVSPGHDASCWHAQFLSALQPRLLAARVLCESVSLPRVGRDGFDFTALDDKLASRPDLIILTTGAGEARALARHVEKTGVPYVLTSGGLQGRFPHRLGTCRHDVSEALEVFAADCRLAGVTSVLWFAWSETDRLDPRTLLERAGIHVETLTLLPAAVGGFDAVFASAGARIRERLGRGPLGDILFVTADYMTMGVLPVLLEQGLRVPEDVRLVTFRNRGFGPAFTKSLACVENDPWAGGEALAEAIMRYLETGVFAAPAQALAYVRGETFPVAGAAEGALRKEKTRRKTQ